MYLNEIMNTFSAAGVGNAPSANFSLIAGLVVFVLLAGGAAAFLLMRRNKQDTAAPTSPVYKLATELKGEQQKADIIVNAIEDGLVLFDEQLTIRTFNPSAARITGWSDGDASNLPLETVVKIIDTKGEPYPEKTDPFRRVFAEKATIRLNDAELLTQSGKHVAISLTISPLINEQQQVFAAVATFRDITVERAEVQRRDDFVSTASHEMRTPVAAIEGYLALALNDKVSIIDSRAREYLEKAHASTQHLGQLFQDLLTSAKAEDGRLSSHPVVVEMGSYLQQLTDDLHFAADKKGLAVEFVAGINNIINASGDGNKVIRPLYYVMVDPDRMREVVTNLFDNAVKYTDKGKITIGLTGNNEVVQFYVSDTGNGIPAEDVPHLFQKFYRVDNSATRTIGGTGLGLYISRKIVELYEGRIWVDSQLNKGTTFYINLPRLNTQEATNLQRTQTYQTVPQ
jgi:PAS domain S-box-containing protein